MELQKKPLVFGNQNDPSVLSFRILKRRHCVEPYLKDRKKLCKIIGINTDIVVPTTTQVEVKTYTGSAKSFFATVQEGCCTSLEVPVPYTKHSTWRTWPVSHADGGHVPTLTANVIPVHSSGFQSNWLSASGKFKASFRWTCVWLRQCMFCLSHHVSWLPEAK